MINTTTTLTAADSVMDRPSAQAAALRCPRCDSTNTKFCYYNNYSLSQPRHFCKACKRYWTRGGTLRNVPVGGGCRKNNKRIKKPTTTAKVPPPHVPSSSSINPHTSMPTLPNPVPNIPSCTTAFDLQLQVSELGAGLASNQLVGDHNDEYHLGHLLPLMNDYYPLFGSLDQQPNKMKEIDQPLVVQENLQQDLGNFETMKESDIEGETKQITYSHTERQLPSVNSWEAFGSAATKFSSSEYSSYLFWNGATTGPAAANLI